MPTPTPTPDPTWEDLSGKWCAAEGDDCFVIDKAVKTITAAHGKQRIKRDADSAASARPPRGCFSGATLAVNGPDAAGLYACLEDVKAPKVTGSGIELSDAERSKARIWMGQDSVWNIVYYREAAKSAQSAKSKDAGGSECTDLSGRQAVRKWISDAPAQENGREDGVRGWGVGGDYDEYVDYTTYDQCADLSWVTLPTAGATAVSPELIMLFHKGTFVGPATQQTVSFPTDVKRIGDGKLSVTYVWAKEGQPLTHLTESSTSTFTWDESTSKVERTGELPPGYTGND